MQYESVQIPFVVCGECGNDCDWRCLSCWLWLLGCEQSRPVQLADISKELATSVSKVVESVYFEDESRTFFPEHG